MWVGVGCLSIDVKLVIDLVYVFVVELGVEMMDVVRVGIGG